MLNTDLVLKYAFHKLIFSAESFRPGILLIIMIILENFRNHFGEILNGQYTYYLNVQYYYNPEQLEALYKIKQTSNIGSYYKDTFINAVANSVGQLG